MTGGLRRACTSPAARATLSLLVVAVVFAGVLPHVGDYSAAWDLVLALTWVETTVLAAVALVNLVSYAPLWVIALPGLRWWRALMTDQASTAVSNTVPAGFAFGVGTTAAMHHSFGHSPAEITRAVVVTGIWNNFVKLGTPVVALSALAFTGDANRALVVAAVLGAGVLAVAIGLLTAVLVHREAAIGLAGVAERMARRWSGRLRYREPHGWVARVDRFRADSRTLLHRRWTALTLAAIGSHAALFLLLLTTLRCVGGAGADVSWARVLAVFALTRLVTLVPITPGALGVAELSYVAGLTTVGVGAAAATGAVLIFRFLTWFLPIPSGVVAWVLWRRGLGRLPDPAGEPALSIR
ncbi:MULTISPECIES: lysylphosphatidylglycerol synthase transmembrane domain-containing protein [unclassified Modestobacter]|uniref:lysylphosphatidylglycerol synthase transmembrane domain-containing protein n=1 Tax=unclassified Modestobacter TaxID=2643866 RepID=UPI0022AB083A|nr:MULTISPECIES: lysylphosphatidylglycerol synthase transmembrane domain-containing protein [unclassified Modestobacter]MCZ2812055.1 lysylphosphatidylglycerol synthase transmembrane domain-containing protein [Modestobacter sp. VKM Ac-2979]MCZ2843779.1 lysylphosphatidylglycerol synthase transmembrane domain-containing protein [Modestobacter sp. VKM Ac-2980]MCZ2849774.1 lysylphosphatidylglycerol synthase transmembrane domain-containing protein [Modestobacter sp. VKM Ac-2978]